MMAFFDKVREGINRRVATVGVKPREVLGAPLLRNQIDTLVKQKRNAVEGLGDAVYALFLKGVFDENTLRKECMAVVSLEGQRLEKEEKLRRVQSKLYGVPGGPAPDESRLPEDDMDGEFLADYGEQMDEAEKSGAESTPSPVCAPSRPLSADPATAGDVPLHETPGQRASEVDQPQGGGLEAAAVAAGANVVREEGGPAPQEAAWGEGRSKGRQEEVAACPTCGTEYWQSAWFGEFLPSERRASNPTGPVSERHSELDPCPAPRVCFQKTLSGKWVRLLSAAAVLLIGIAGGSLFYAGHVARSPMVIEAQLNDRLNAKGLNVSAVIAKDRTATITGSVPTRKEKELAIALVKSNRLVKSVSDKIVAQEDVTALKEKLSGVVQDMVALKNAVVTRHAVDKGVPGAADAPVIGRTYGIFVPETYAAFSIKDDGTIKTTIRNIAGEVNDRTVQLMPSPDLTVWRWASDIDETYLPFRPGDEIREVTPSPPASAPLSASRPAPKRPKPVAVKVHKPKRTPLPKTVMRARATPQPPVTHSKPQPPVTRVPTASIDSAELEGEINRSLQSAGIKGVIAKVGDDMAAILKGTTSGIPDKQRAFEIARGFRGIRDVKDIVFVIPQ